MGLFHVVYAQTSQCYIPSGYVKIALLKMAIEIVDFPIKNGGSFHSFLYVHQRVISIIWRPGDTPLC